MENKEVRETFPLGKAMLLAASPLLHGIVKRLHHRPETRKITEQATIFNLVSIADSLCMSGAWHRAEIRTSTPALGFDLTIRVLVQPSPMVAWEEGLYHLKETEDGNLFVYTDYAIEHSSVGTKEIEINSDDIAKNSHREDCG